MVHELIDPSDPPERQNQKLLKIVETLMRRAEQARMPPARPTPSSSAL